MSAQPDKSQQTERPTPRQIKRAFEDGNLPRSIEVGQAMSLAVFLVWALVGGGTFIAGIMNRMRNALLIAGQPVGSTAMIDALMESAFGAMALAAPLLLVLVVLAVGGQIAQTGFHPRKQPVPFEPRRLDPVKGLKNFVTLDKLFQAAKALSRVAFYALLAGLVLVPEWDRVSGLSLATPGKIFSETMWIALRILLRALLLGALLSAIDLGFTRYRWHRKLFMTKQQVKDEHKETDGDPQIKSRLRERQRQMSRRRMMDDVRNADTVVTNPEHVAAARKYAKASMDSPLARVRGNRNRVYRGLAELERDEESSQ